MSEFWILAILCCCNPPKKDPDGDRNPASDSTSSETGSASEDDTGTEEDENPTASDNGEDSSRDTDSSVAPLPKGSTVHRYVVNLVDSELAQLYEEYTRQSVAPDQGGEGTTLAAASAKFFTFFEDEYDFLFFVGTEQYSETVGGRHGWVHVETIPGTGVYSKSGKEEYGNTKRLKSCIGLTYFEQKRPPFAHEMLHHWAVHLDSMLGFGDGYEGALGSHWGSVSVDGQLGGFDETTLRCESPRGAVPPNCTPETDGTILYRVGVYTPFSACEDEKPYADLELYLMGLQTVEDVRRRFIKIDNAHWEEAVADDGELIVSGTGLSEITMDSIIAVHGKRTPLAEADRHLRGALVVLSDTPASDDVMARAHSWAASFGGHEEVPGWPSYSESTGGLGTIDMTIGARRSASDTGMDTDSTPLVDGDCDIFAQDCPADYGCYEIENPVCLKEGTGELRATCARDDDCVRGMGCVGSGICLPWCDIQNDDREASCAVRCPNGYGVIADEQTGDHIMGLCVHGEEQPCDPLASQCDDGWGCYGRSPATCLPAGTVGEGESCEYITSNECAPGLMCVGIADADTKTCESYCNPIAADETGCDAICSGGNWPFGNHSICIPAR